jgi:aminopeptidase N
VDEGGLRKLHGAKIVNPSFPNVNHDLRFLLGNYPAAYEVDRTPGANPIRQQLDNLNEAGSMYGAIIYQKAPIVMRHLEAILGEDNFRDGLREYLKAHAFANATWSDLINVLDARTPMDLQQWSQVLGRSTGTPVGRDDSRNEERQHHEARVPPARFVEPQSRVAASTAGRHRIACPAADDHRRAHRPRVEVKQAVGQPVPRFVLPNGGGWAYGDFTLDKTTLAYLTTNLPDIADPLTRGSAWVTLWDALLDGQVPPENFLDLTCAACRVRPMSS